MDGIDASLFRSEHVQESPVAFSIDNASPSFVKKQKRLGPAPIASFEDTTAEDKHRMDNTGQTHKSRWYSAKEFESPQKQSPPNTIGNTSALAPSTPRIDISRASSHSSHHDSRDSSPENVFDQVGTGTLQDSGVLGYREEGTMDLRSSTEELQFMEPVKGGTEREKPQVPRVSPIMFKLDEQQQISLHHHRKDSASSEVAAFLCISGRTSRISSVGSQGSANSKLSAVSGVSGISRSPSPHRMLLETSFCGPKPLQGITDGSVPSSIEPSTAKMLEQVILSRKRDPTEAVLADGVNVDTNFIANNVVQETELTRRKSDSNANITRKDEIVHPSQTSRSISAKRYIPPKDLTKPIVGIMPSGTEYIRIKLKPDHCYRDNGIGENERILYDDQRKPNSLDLNKRNSCSISPKPIRQVKLSHENGSRSPSPANTSFSRKSSFCSIFKLKESASPDTPGASNSRKKSGSNGSHECKERSRSKSKERDPVSLNTTPSKQKSVLAIFKPRKNGSKSKSPSPIDSNPHDTLSAVTNVEFNFRTEPQSSSNGRSQLRYYDTPLDGKSIYIPLHTPPEEKQSKSFVTSDASIQPKSMEQPRAETPAQPSTSSQPTSMSNNCTITIHNRPKPMPPLKCYRIENPDGSITIPLKSPTEDKERDSLWSMDVQRNSSQDSQDTVVSAAAPQHHVTPPNSANALSLTGLKNSTAKPTLHDSEDKIPNNSTETNIDPIHLTNVSGMSAKERKQLLFSMKMGSGSQEQVFSTQFSISKTESQCSQLSEIETNELNLDIAESNERPTSSTGIQSVVYRNKQLNSVKKRSLEDGTLNELQDTQRHSRYIENKEELLSSQLKANTSKRQNKLNTTVSEESSISQDTSKEESTIKLSLTKGMALKVPEQRSTGSNEEQGISSESEKDSEFDSATTDKHLHPGMLAIEDHESAGLVLQESFDDELPYIPTTLPEERSFGVKLVPMKERAQMEMKTCPLERPRSATPIHPASLENYCGITNSTDEIEGGLIRGEKLRISLPRKHDMPLERPPKTRSPRKNSTSSSRNWFEFGEPGISSNIGQISTTSNGNETANSGFPMNVDEEPPPLPPRKTSVAAQQWINFESIPEKRKPPKRITSLSRRDSSVENVPATELLYNYVKPEECQCECHGNEREESKQDHEVEDQQPLILQDLGDPNNRRCNDVQHEQLSIRDTSSTQPDATNEKPE